jgi:dTDP-4-dehydrorhamnose reductase
MFSLKSMPAWVTALLGVRQAVVGLMGINKAPAGVFAVSKVQGEEALISADDTHLDFRCGVAYDAGARLLRVTTVVRLKGWRGRLYFLPVRLLHPLVVHAMMARAIRRLASGL